MAKTIRVSAQVNGRKALDSKICETVEEAFHDVRKKMEANNGKQIQIPAWKASKLFEH